MKNIVLPLMFIAEIYCFQSCKGDACKGGNTTNNYNISENNKAAIPYLGTESLVFVNDSGDTATLYLKGRQQFYHSYNSLINPDCTNEKIENFEHIEIEYTGNHPIITSISYKVYRSQANITGDFTNFQIKISNILLSENTFEFSSFSLPIEDSIYFNNKYSSGGFIDETKTILYNKEYGILKFKFSNLTWKKIK